MVKAWIVDKVGSLESSLSLVNLEVPLVGATDVLIKHQTLGLNEVDLLQQKGFYPLMSNKVIGCEVVGVVEGLGNDVPEFRKGDRVAYATVFGGGCAEYSVVDRSCVVPVPNYVDNDSAAALLRKGMLAHMLLRRTFFVNKDTFILVNNVANGVGRLLASLGKHYGAKVLATCSSELEYNSVSSLGIDLLIDISKDDFIEKVLSFTKSGGVNVVYDFFGSKTFLKSLECLAFFGLLVNLENSYGQESNLDITKLFSRSAFVTSPSLSVYKQVRQELLLSSNEVFALVQKKVISANIKKYKFAEIRQAYTDLADGKILGQLVVEL
jgi:NADPH:quinone reductase